MKQHAKIGFTALVLLALSGCASVAVKNNDLERRAAAATGMQIGTFAITDRADSGIRTDFVAKGNDGRVFNCYVTGTIGVTGSTVSDALCSQASSKPSAATSN